MFLTHLQASNFRNYKTLDLSFNEQRNINLIVAKNGMGKSNFLEMLYYLSHLRAFRNASDKDLILHGQNNFHLFCEYESKGIHGNVRVKYSGKKEILLDDKKIVKHSQILGKLQTVFFGSNDISIISGTPAERRVFFDIFLSIIDSDYLAALRTYDLLLKQKNALIKSKRNDILSFFDVQIADAAFLLITKRKLLIEKVNRLFSELFKDIGNFKDNAFIRYNSSFEREFNSAKELLNYILYQDKFDFDKGYCIFGPHKDNYYFILNNTIFSKYASLGQIRLGALVLKLIQAVCYEEKFSTSPILLLDDVILELDSEKQKRFLNRVCGKYQLFITLTDERFKNFFNNQNAVEIIRVNNGSIL